ncbi:MAG: hypothetical protein ACKVS6_12445 [Planctomycetota bacterium]
MTQSTRTQSLWLAPLAALLLTSSTAPAQIPTGGFQVGDVYVWSASLHASAVQGSFQGLVRVDGITGATSLVKEVNSIYGSINYDPYRDRLSMAMSLTSGTNGFYLCDAAGNLNEIPLPFLPNANFSGPDGKIYLVHFNGSKSTLHYLDSNNVLHDVLNAAGTGKYIIEATNSFRRYYYDAGTNSILVFYAGVNAPCGGSGSRPWVNRISLTPDGSQVVGVEAATPLCVTAASTAMGVMRGPGDKIMVSMNVTTQGIQVHHILLDPVTLTFTNYASAYNLGSCTGVYSHVRQCALMLDTFYDNIRMFYQGQVDETSTSGIEFTPKTSDPQISSTGGSSEIVYMTIVDYGNYGHMDYGAGTSGCNGAQRLEGAGTPKAGTTSYRLVGSNVPPNSLGLCLVTDVPDFVGNDQLGIGVTLHLDLALSTEINILDINSDSVGNAATPPITIPASLVGLDFYAQAIWYWTSCSLPPLNLSSTNGLKITIQ